jgi:hypothetical protein
MAAVLRSAWEVADCTASREAWSNAEVAVAVALSSACAAMVATSKSFNTCFDVEWRRKIWVGGLGHGACAAMVVVQYLVKSGHKYGVWGLLGCVICRS